MTDSVYEMEKALKARSAAQRLEAVRRFRSLPPGILPPVDRKKILLRALTDRSNLVVAEAVKGLTEEPDPQVAEAMIERYHWFAVDGLRRDPGCVARQELVSSLAAMGARRAAPVFFDAIETVQVEASGAGLEDMAVGLRGRAALAMARLGLPGALLAISLLLFDDEPKAPTAPQAAPFATMLARRMAAQALAELGDPGAVAPLGLKLARPGSEVPEVLVPCMDALAELDDEAAMKMIPPYLSGENPYLVAGAATALAALSASHQETVLEMLVEACRSQVLETKEAIALAIASMRGEGPFVALEGLAFADDPSVRMAAIPAVAQKGGPPAKEILTRLAHDPDALVARLARRSLEQVEV